MPAAQAAPPGDVHGKGVLETAELNLFQDPAFSGDLCKPHLFLSALRFEQSDPFQVDSMNTGWLAGKRLWLHAMEVSTRKQTQQMQMVFLKFIFCCRRSGQEH